MRIAARLTSTMSAVLASPQVSQSASASRYVLSASSQRARSAYARPMSFSKFATYVSSPSAAVAGETRPIVTQRARYVAAHARDDAEVLLDHRDETGVAGDLCHPTRFLVERFRFIELAALPVADGDDVLRVRDRRRVAAHLGDGEGGGRRNRGLPRHRRRRDTSRPMRRRIIDASSASRSERKQVERTLVAPTRELALAGAFGAMRFVEQRADRRRMAAAGGASGRARRPHQRTSWMVSRAAEATV